MGQIVSYLVDENIDEDDKLLGSGSEGGTKNFRIADLSEYFESYIQASGITMSGSAIVSAINTELGGTSWQIDTDTQLTNAEVVTAINTQIGSTDWQSRLSGSEVVNLINVELSGTTWQSGGGTGGTMTGAQIVAAIDFELGSTVWKFDNDTQLTNAQVVTAINTELGNTNWQTDTDTNTQLTNAEVVTAVNTELGNTNWQTDTNTQLTNTEVVTAINTQLGNTDWQTDTNTQLTATEVVAAIDGSIGTGWKREDFATTAQGTKADSAVQTSSSNYSFANVISSTLVNLTISAGSVNWNADGRNLHKIVLTSNCTLENGSNPISGTQYQFIVEQDATGGYTLSYGNLFRFPGGNAPTIPIAANSKSIITCLFDGTHYLAVSAENFS